MGAINNAFNQAAGAAAGAALAIKHAKERDKRNMRGLPKAAKQPLPNVYGLPGKVLQIDGDKEYLKICLDVYSQLGIPAVGVAIPEANQYKEVKKLLEKHKPDILVITGHDALYVKNGDLKNINNYRNFLLHLIF